ncbi:MAG TPA: alpha/beta hydrolase [Thermoanaerobaculia bacterium]|nr:alpha/beta hydrolase [Thermoanaerobaculia bacterium]
MDSSTRRSLSRVAVIGTATVASLELARIIFRNHQLFDPDCEPLVSWNPADYGLDPERVDSVQFQSLDGTPLHGWYCRAERPIASALYCHGNTGNLTYSAGVIPLLVDAGISVLLFDYRGYGKSEGKPSLRGLIKDGRAAAKYHDLIRPEGVPSLLYGFSLGGAVGAQALRSVRFGGLVLQSTFTNLGDMARFKFGRIPFHLISGRELDTLRVLPDYDLPLLLLHGTEDEVVPCWMGQRLFSTFPYQKELLLVEHGQHGDLYIRESERIIEGLRRLASAAAERFTPVLAAPGMSCLSGTGFTNSALD